MIFPTWTTDWLKEKLYSLMYPDNRMTLEEALSGSVTPFDVMANSFTDRGIWRLSSERMRLLCSPDRAIMIPTYDQGRNNFGFTIAMTDKLAYRSVGIPEIDLTYEAQQVLSQYVANWNRPIAFQFHRVAVYENGDHLEMTAVLSKYPHLITRDEISSDRERKKRETTKRYDDDDDF